MKLKHTAKLLALLSAILLICNMVPVTALASSAGPLTDVFYVDENGEERTAQAVPIEAGDTQLPGGWYVMDKSISLENGISFSGDANLIICDGEKFTLEDPGYGIYCAGNLTVYGQKESSGVLTCIGHEAGVYAEGNYAHVGGLILGYGRVTGLGAGRGIEMKGGTLICSAGEYGLKSEGDLTMTGGELTGIVNAENGTAVFAKNNAAILGGNFGTFADGYRQSGLVADEGTITLSWTDTLDSVYANSYNKPVTFLKAFRDDMSYYLFPAGYVCEDTAEIAALPLCPVLDELTITFDADGGSGEMAAQPVYFSMFYELPECGFGAPAGKTFDRWDLGDPGTYLVVTEDLTVRALWKDMPGSVSGNSAEEPSVSGNSAVSSAGVSGSASAAGSTSAAGSAVSSVSTGSSGSAGTVQRRAVETGDENNIILWAALILVVAGSLYVLSKKGK